MKADFISRDSFTLQGDIKEYRNTLEDKQEGLLSMNLLLEEYKDNDSCKTLKSIIKRVFSKEIKAQEDKFNEF